MIRISVRAFLVSDEGGMSMCPEASASVRNIEGAQQFSEQMFEKYEASSPEEIIRDILGEGSPLEDLDWRRMTDEEISDYLDEERNESSAITIPHTAGD